VRHGAEENAKVPVNQVNRKRLRQRLDEMAAIGATAKGGLHRLALSDADGAARRRLESWAGAAGYNLVVDAIGNMFATRPGAIDGAPAFMIGSHLDSQPYAGRFDGAAGVVAAFEVMTTLDDLGITTSAPVQLVNWTNEEGARFRPPLIGSGVFAGTYALDSALAIADDAGATIGQELARLGFAGDTAPGWPLAGYVEIHIEQGTVLERAGATIGIVTGVVGIRDIMVRVTGEDTHAGPLDMHLRRDALVGAAEMILAANRIGLTNAPDARVTVGRISVPSNSHSVVPGLAEFVLDIRHPETEGLDTLETELRAAFVEIAAAHRLEVTFDPMWAYPVVRFDDRLNQAVGAAADRLGYRRLALPSRAGHDAWNVSRVAPTTMIFIPCKDGISHNEAEFAAFDDIAAAADVMLGAIIETDAGTRR
jgi:N-carbamoyl-L-amino-acid hydrolase